MESSEKYTSLKKYLESLQSVVVAFSGGVDSTFLLKVAKEVLNDKVLAVTIVSPYIPKWEVEEAKELAKKIGVKQELLEIPVILNDIKYNPENRCYLCKKFIFSQVIEIRKQKGFKYVVDGTNMDDTKDYRPGMVALKELKVISPLLENQITKSEIRQFSKELNLSTWNKPPYACLLSRIPYNEEIKEEKLRRIELAEVYLMKMGFSGMRVRSHEDLARIELKEEDKNKIFNKELMNKIVMEFKNIGFTYVTLDLEGYKMGSFNRKFQ